MILSCISCPGERRPMGKKAAPDRKPPRPDPYLEPQLGPRTAEIGNARGCHGCMAGVGTLGYRMQSAEHLLSAPRAPSGNAFNHVAATDVRGGPREHCPPKSRKPAGPACFDRWPARPDYLPEAWPSSLSWAPSIEACVTWLLELGCCGHAKMG